VSRRLPLALGAVVALAAVIRFATLDAQSFWLDETVTVRLVRLGFREMLGEIPGSESTPPLYYVLAWFWSRVLGDGEVGLRALSALVGTLTVPVIYAIGARLLSQRAGLLAAGLAAVNPLLVWYSQEARAYGLLVLLAALSILFFIHAREQPSPGGWPPGPLSARSLSPPTTSAAFSWRRRQPGCSRPYAGPSACGRRWPVPASWLSRSPCCRSRSSSARTAARSGSTD
jgi:4-amino-4-deoxy-L-arabinose transferase-like glycosyltransferase